MTYLADLTGAVERLAVFAELDVDVDRLPLSACELSDESVRLVFDAFSALVRDVQKGQAVLAGVIAARSRRDAGHSGLAQTGGFRTPVQFVQDATGVTKREAERVVRVGVSLIDGDAVAGSAGAGQPGGAGAADAVDAAGAGESGESVPWHRPLRDALLTGGLTQAQHEAIRRGLGEPPAIDDRRDEDVVEVWRHAAAMLIDTATGVTVEALADAARSLRDQIDPRGAQQRWEQHFARRSYRSYRDADGQCHAHLVFDDETAAFWDDVIATALRPRRGGPRFVSDDEKVRATQLQHDPRTNEQLSYDLVTDVFRAGALATAADVYGARQAGVRLVAVADAVGTRDAFDRLLAVTHTEDGAFTMPGSVLDRALCTVGALEATFDTFGNPLDLGRESRLYTAKQRLVLALRDGGCVWPGCDRPPAYCEAHHCDHWHADHGRTDVDRGALLCRFHHIHLHTAGWKITRDGDGPHVLHPPPGDPSPPIELRSKSPLRWLFDPPERRPWRTAAA
ncbi:HNH endonuclease [Microbacterium sp. W1N]|uniref:HNH endonuclease signature motif containing protein n=1 Tax=Microbacterium festucae TaxID=2977531 RepID=UPI0021C0A237|nr:HNH endonuclease signature motif containing protein [Microbacterium festucae]MCT9819045.1 HNH endonuclease [Microbacterium festucae]